MAVRRKKNRRPSRTPLAKKTVTSPDPFRHVVVLMLENRSFDHALGALQGRIPVLEGIPPGGTPRSNPDPSGQPVQQLPGAGRTVDPDPMHETPNVLEQLKDQMGKFVKDYARAYPKRRHRSGAR